MSQFTSSSVGGEESLHAMAKAAEYITTDPFNTPFDADEDDNDDDSQDDKWWNDEGSPILNQEESSAPSRLARSKTFTKRTVGTITKSTPRTARKSVKRYSVQKPVRDKSRHRQKRQNAAAGIKVVTNFSLHRGHMPPAQQPIAPSEALQNVPQSRCFVNLAALQAMEGQAPQSTTGFWKSVKGIIPGRLEATNEQGAEKVGQANLLRPPNPAVTASPSQGFGSHRGQDLLLAPLKIESDLSPSDRPIVIGISIPSASMAQHFPDPQTAVSETTTFVHSANSLKPGDGGPNTPTIVITPSQTHSNWFRSPQKDSASQQRRSRATSSVYSRASVHSQNGYMSSNAPPMPQIPHSALAGMSKRQRKSGKSVRNSSSTIFSEDAGLYSARKSRAFSSYTVFEEDESPILARRARAVSFSEGNMSGKHVSSTSVADQRTSRGWWNYLTSPFLTRSNTLVSPTGVHQDQPALPILTTATINAYEAGRNIREWEKSSFSPLTPETSTTIASDAWWDKQTIIGDMIKGLDNSENVHSPDEEAATLPFVLGSDLQQRVEAVYQERSANGNQLERNTSVNLEDSQVNLHGAVPPFRPVDSRVTPPVTITSSHAPQNHMDNLNVSAQGPRPQPGNTGSQVTASHEARFTASPRESQQEEPQPPPYSPPRAYHPRYRAIFPPGHQSNLREPLSPGPISPGLQQAMASRGGIALSDVPLTPTPRRPINLNSGYPGGPARHAGLPLTAADLGAAPSEKARQAEARRQRHEKEDALAHKVGGLWRGRGCVPKRGCYGRSGAEGRKRRRCWFGLIAGFLTMIILIVVLATTLHHDSNTIAEQSQWLNLTGFPPIFTGISTVASPDNPVANTGCVFPATVWSCSLPKELQQSSGANIPNQPNFKVQIQWDNSSLANATFANVTGNANLSSRNLGSNAASAGDIVRRLILKARKTITFTPSPAPPTYAEQFFLGSTTDGIVSPDKAGEATPFYMSFLSTSELNSTSSTVQKRGNSSDPFPDTSNIINTLFPPDVNKDWTAAPANLLPFPVQQPLRLYDRGLESEHYGFYNYFNRSIFLKSLVPLNSSNDGNGEVPDDENGGCSESEAAWRCTWSETRFLVQMWTRKGSSVSLVNITSSTSATTYPPGYNAQDFTRPGSFPYPITITTDRHGGKPLEKELYCYGIDSREHIITSVAKPWGEQRGFGGVAINAAPSVFLNVTDSSLGGFDGGSGGCSCQWTNWKRIVQG